MNVYPLVEGIALHQAILSSQGVFPLRTYGLAPDRMSDADLWRRLESNIGVSHMMARNRDPLAARLQKLDECAAIAAELKVRGTQLALLPDRPLGATEQASAPPLGRNVPNHLWVP